MKKLILVGYLLTLGQQIFGCDQQSKNENSLIGVRHYKGEPITPNNIIKLMGTIPNDALMVVRQFLASNSSALHVKTLLTPLQLPVSTEKPDNDLEAFEQLLRLITPAYQQKSMLDQEAMALMATPEKIGHNYVFRCPNDERWIIKIASLNNRIINLLAAAGFNIYNHKSMGYRDADITAFKSQPTYQTISCAQINLMVQEVIAKHNCQHISVPETYLYQLPVGLTTDTANDSNSFIVQEFVPGLKRLSQASDLIDDQELITTPMVQELKLAIVHAALWDIKANLAICMEPTSKHHKKLVLFDTEQRNLSSPAEFTYMSPKLYQQITAVGLQQAADLFAARPDLVEILKN